LGRVASVVIMAGGRARRLGYVCKPLMRICGDRLIIKSINVGLKVSSNIVVTYTKYTKEVTEVCDEVGIKCVETRGEGYSKDLSEVLSRTNLPALILPADLPFITYAVIKDFINKALSLNASVISLCVIDNDTCRLVGISIIKELGGNEALIPYPPSIELMDVDTLNDLIKVKEACASMEGLGRE